MAKSRPEKKQPERIEVLEPKKLFCDRAFILNDEEHFVFAFQTGTVIGGQFVFSPKHAKRFMLKLQEKIAAYEKEHGKLKTELPQKDAR